MSSVKIFSVKGIDVKVHYSLILVIFLFSYVFYVMPPPYGFRDVSYSLPLSILASVSLLISVLLHELGHSLLSLRKGIRVREIILFIFGGIAVLETQPKGKDELVVSLVGPLVSLVIAFAFYLISLSGIPLLKEFSDVFFRVNLVIALFNLLPAFPLDGGRILRGYLTEKIGFRKATIICGELGKSLAIFLAIIGLFYNIWLTLIAIFIYLGASEEEKLSKIESIFEKLRVRDIMTRYVKTVSPEMTVEEFIEFVFENKHLGYPVTDNGKVIGMITLHDVVGKDKHMKIKDIMKTNVVSLSPDDSAFKAFKIVNETGLGRIPVIENGKLVGIVSKTDLVRVMQIMEVLNVE
uniref:Zinc metalloprotease n=1 Tax=Geoglobus ahangari TaxID=113653 RepID=A0A7C4S6I9_9EURY